MAGGLFYAAANHWAADQNSENAGASLGPLLLALAFGALLSFPLRKVVESLGEPIGTGVTFVTSGLAIFVLAMLTFKNVYLFYITVTVCGIGVGLMYARTIYLLHLNTDEDVIGRIISLREMFGAICFSATILLSGLFQGFGFRFGWLLSATVLIVSGLIFMVKCNKIRIST